MGINSRKKEVCDGLKYQILREEPSWISVSIVERKIETGNSIIKANPSIPPSSPSVSCSNISTSPKPSKIAKEDPIISPPIFNSLPILFNPSWSNVTQETVQTRIFPYRHRLYYLHAANP